MRAVLAQMGGRGRAALRAATPPPAAAAPTAWAACSARAPSASACRPDGSLYPRDIARTIDHTLLKPDATREQIETLCAEAREHGFATVCVNPAWVPLCADLLRGLGDARLHGGRLPPGRDPPRGQGLRGRARGGGGRLRGRHGPERRRAQVRRLPPGASGTSRAWWRPATAAARMVKVIIEAALLTDDEKVQGLRRSPRRRAPTS